MFDIEQFVHWGISRIISNESHLLDTYQKQKQLSAEDVGLLKNPICQELVQCTDEAGEEYCFRGSGGVVKYSKNKNREKKMGRTLNCSEHIEVEARTSEGSLSIALLC